MDGRGTKCRRQIAEIYNRLSRVHEGYRQIDDRQTDGRATANSERKREFTFAKKSWICPNLPLTWGKTGHDGGVGWDNGGFGVAQSRYVVPQLKCLAKIAVSRFTARLFTFRTRR